MGIFAPTKPGSENSIFTAAGLFLATTWITLSLRIWVRTALAKSFGCDDAILLLSAVSHDCPSYFMHSLTRSSCHSLGSVPWSLLSRLWEALST